MPYLLILVAAVTVPMQGLPNFLVYLRPRLQRARRLNPNGRWYKWFAQSALLDDSNFLSMSRHHSSVSDDCSQASGNPSKPIGLDGNGERDDVPPHGDGAPV